MDLRERIGLTGKDENKTTFVAVTGFGNGNAGIITEDNYSVGVQIPVNVNETGANPSNGCFGVGNGNGDGLSRCDAVGNCGDDRLGREYSGQFIDVIGGDYVTESKLDRFRKQHVTDCKGASETVFC